MSNNGFFHERPRDYDIWVAEELRSQLGAYSLNGHIIIPRYEERGEVATVIFRGSAYLATCCRRGADAYWTVIAKDVDVVVVGEDTAFVGQRNHSSHIKEDPP